MAYLGNSLTVQQYAPRIAYFSGNASTTSFTLPYAVVSAAQIIVSIENVIQNPSTAFSVSGTTITFTSAPPSGTNNIWVEYTSLQTSVNALPASPSIVGPMLVSINNAPALGGATNPIIGSSGSANNYVQTYVYNTFNGANSSADFTAYPSNGADAAGWVDMGITGPSFSQAAYSITGPNEAYLFGSAPAGSGTTGNLVLATDSTGTANAIQFYTGGFTQAKSAARMTIDSSGNVGIGVTPSAWSTNYGIKALDISNGTVYGSTQDTNLVSNAYFNAGNSWIYKTTNTAAYYTINASGDHRWSTAPSGTAGTAVTWTERMRIDSSGNLLVGSTAQFNSGKVCFAYDGTVYNGLALKTTNATLNSNYLAFINSAGTAAGTVVQTGTTTVAYGTSSDYRLKENIAPITGALNKISALKPVTYNWKSDGSDGQGFIAHELAEVCPEAVIGEKDAVDVEGNAVYQGIDTSFLVATLTAAIQELKAFVDAQAAEIAALKGAK